MAAIAEKWHNFDDIYHNIFVLNTFFDMYNAGFGACIIDNIHNY